MTQNPPDRVMEEYKSLRTEILQLLEREVRLVIFSFTATAAILGFAFTQQRPLREGAPLLFLIPLLVLTLVLLQLNDTARSLVRIAVYIRIFLELNDPALNWETKMNELRGKVQDDPFPPNVELGTFRRILTFKRIVANTPLFSTQFYEIAAIILGFISIFLALSYADSLFEYVACGGAFAFWGFISATSHIQLQHVQSGRFKEYMECKWKALKRDNDNQTFR